MLRPRTANTEGVGMDRVIDCAAMTVIGMLGLQAVALFLDALWPL